MLRFRKMPMTLEEQIWQALRTNHLMDLSAAYQRCFASAADSTKFGIDQRTLRKLARAIMLAARRDLEIAVKSKDDAAVERLRQQIDTSVALRPLLYVTMKRLARSMGVAWGPPGEEEEEEETNADAAGGAMGFGVGQMYSAGGGDGGADVSINYDSFLSSGAVGRALSASAADRSGGSFDLAAGRTDYSTSRTDYFASGGRSDKAAARADLTAVRRDDGAGRAEYTRSRADNTTSRADYTSSRADFASSRADHATSRSDDTTSRADYATSRADYATSRADCATARAGYAGGRADLTAGRADYGNGRADYSTGRTVVTRTITTRQMAPAPAPAPAPPPPEAEERVSRASSLSSEVVRTKAAAVNRLQTFTHVTRTYHEHSEDEDANVTEVRTRSSRQARKVDPAERREIWMSLLQEIVGRVQTETGQVGVAMQRDLMDRYGPDLMAALKGDTSVEEMEKSMRAIGDAWRNTWMCF